MSLPASVTALDRTVIRMRHDIRIRVLTVSAITDLSSNLRRITLEGSDLEGFSSPGYDDHIKVFFSENPDDPVLPALGPDGLQFPEGERPQMRDYTPRNFDPVASTLDIEFVLHGTGPAASWAAQARIGQKLVIAGPRGSAIVPLAFDWYLLAGDESALPAIARRLAEFAPGTRALVAIEIGTEADRVALDTGDGIDIVWACRNGAGSALAEAVARFELPSGDGYAFIAGEAETSRAIKTMLVADRGMNPDWIKAAGYWKRGEADAHEPH